MTNHSPLTGRLEKEMKTQFFFEKIGCPYFFSVVDQLLLIYSSGKTNGFVVNFGHEQANVVPILEGQPILYG
jgi:actin-related protein